MTLEKLIKGISQDIYKEFGKGYAIYSESIPQGFREPCFYIKPIEMSREQGLDRKRKKYYQFGIHYFPEECRHKNKSMNEVYETLTNILEYIEIDEQLYRGTEMRSTIQDDVLHFFVNYDFHVIKSRDKNYMETLYQKGATK